MNTCVLIGRLTRDPDLRYVQSGTAVTRFTLAVDRQFKKDETDFLNCVCFGKTAENIANHLQKGRLVGVEGSIQTGSYEKSDGTKVYTTDIIANAVQFLDRPKPQENNDPGDDFQF